MPCYPLHFSASTYHAVHHRFCLKTCIKLKQQKLYCYLIWYCHFPKVYLLRIAVLTVTSSVSAHLGGSQSPSQSEVQEAWWKCFHLRRAQGSLLALHVAHQVWETRHRGSAKAKFSSPAKCHRAFNIYPVEITIIKVSFPLPPEMD